MPKFFSMSALPGVHDTVKIFYIVLFKVGYNNMTNLVRDKSFEKKG